MARVLVLGGSDEAAVVCSAAEDLGFDVIVACPRSDEVAVGRRLWVGCDVYGDPEEQASRVRASSLFWDHVVCGCVDAPVLASLLGSRIPVEVARRCSDKALMVEALGDLAPPTLPGDAVVKPRRSRGSRGVAYVDGSEQVVQALVRGQQLSTEGVVVGGRYYHVADADRYYPDEMRPVEAGGSLPAAITAQRRADVVAALQLAACRVGLEFGILKGDLCIDYSNRIWIFEIACRLSGGYFATDQIVRSTCVSLPRIAITLEAGGEQWIPPRLCRGCAPKPITKRLVWAPPGRIVSVSYPDVEGVLRVVEHLHAGDTSIGPGQNWGALATAIGTSVEACERWVDGVRVEVEP